MAPITLETWAWIGQAVIYGGSLACAISAIVALFKKIRSRTTTAKLEETVTLYGQWFHNDHEHLKRHDREIAQLQSESKDLHELCRMELVASQALLKSMLENGNNHEEMKEAYTKIQKYLENHI